MFGWFKKKPTPVAKLTTVKLAAQEIAKIMEEDGFDPPKAGERPSQYIPKLLTYIKHIKGIK